ncbi:hypothetical protein EDD80_102366 [Anseongella ginsenosidimutans]|uniref:DUF7847 domain-containing protein n=1 Tax=Anseongella ginsenosidimutans TaxID=496056 RepID=A0A4R3KYU7_9SPHI|nr:hypothetical protein [Anseongella ginsenosidimutans]QEC51801.1 hypothetical protein FRZ59_05245 [Anseongella ginsenosidimutans]TCS89172.1 hypothetical protein EDD80_102366 [Anseongella ginsenosidimutans]
MEKINLREERDFGQKISDTFLFLQQNFGPLFKSLLYYAGPVSLVAGVFMGLYQSNLLTLNVESMGESSDPFQFMSRNIFNVNYIVTLIVTGIGRIVVIGVTFAYMCAYLERPGEMISTGEVWERFKQRFVSLFLATWVYLFGLFFMTLAISLILMLVFFGTLTDFAAIGERAFLVPVAAIFILCPLLFVAVRTGLFAPVIFAEGKSWPASYSRSWKLVSGKWWSTFGLIVVVSIIVTIIGIAFQIPILLISFFKEILQWENGSSVQMIIILASIIGMLGETLLYSILHIAIGFQYFNLVERQESIGLMREIDSLGREKDFNPNEGEY